MLPSLPSARRARLLLSICLQLAILPLFAQQVGEWYHQASTGEVPKLRSDAGFVKVGDRAYLLGGYGNTPIQQYDPKSRKWENTKSILNNIHHFQGRVYREKIYIIGAFTGHHPTEYAYGDLLAYDPKDDRVQTVGQIPGARRRGAAGLVVHNDQFYLIGGNRSGHQAGSVAWLDRYDPATKTWTSLPDAPRTRDHFTAEVIGDHIYVAGGGRSALGQSGDLYGNLVAAVDVYDIREGRWLTPAECPQPVPAPGSGTVTAVLNGQLLMFGGMAQANGSARMTTSIMDPATGQWRTLRHMIQGRHATQAAVFNDRVYVAAGSSGGMNNRIEPHLPFVEYFSLQPQPVNRYEDWTVIGNANYRRAEGQMISYRGEFYFFNGFDNDLQLQHNNEKYNPATNRWTKIASQPAVDHPAATHTGVALVGDVVWVVGGRIGSHPGRVTDEVWLYDISEDKWTQGPRMPVRIGAGGLAHIGNKLHYVGGFDENAGCDVDDHWVYDLSRPQLGWQDYSDRSPMPMARNHFGTVVHGGKMYTIGGQHDHDACDKGKNLKLVHVYDPLTDRWERLEDLPDVQSHTEPSTFAYNKKLYTLGGQGAEAREVWEYDPVEDKWHNLKEMELPLRLIAPGARVWGGNLFAMVGGEVAVDRPVTEVRATYFGPNTTHELAFLPGRWEPRLDQSIATNVLLVNYGAEDEAAYTIDPASLPSWLTVDRPTGVARESFTSLSLRIDTSRLTNGSYTHTLTARAEGYQPARLNIEFTVSGKQGTEEPEDKDDTTPDPDPDPEPDPDDEEGTGGGGEVPGPPTDTIVPAAYWLEAECATVGSRWTTSLSSSASNGAYVSPTDGSFSRDAPPAGAGSSVVFREFIEHDGDYYLSARISATDTDGDSFWLRINGGSWIAWNRGLITDSDFAWRQTPENPFSLPTGEVTIEFAYREPGIKLDKIYLGTENTIPDHAGGEATTCTVPTPDNCPDGNCATEYWAEAECTEIGGNWTIGYAREKDIRYVYTTGASDYTGAETDRETNVVKFTTDALEEGTYYLFCHLMAPDNSSNSFWIRVDDGDWIKFWKEESGLNMLTTGFEWRRVNDDTRPVSFTLPAGRHVITIAKRETKTRLDRILLKQDPGVPTTIGPPLEQCPQSMPSLASGPVPGTAFDDTNLAAPELEIFPNPAAQLLNFNLVGPLLESVDLTVMDANGRKVVEQSFAAPHKLLNGQVNVSMLPPGIYLLRVVCSSGQVTQSFRKL
ncbi:kelch repeat-containing protein [Lewinella sp. JB7]|uniref:Kelch repeat-containing protein n=1 Tax=Lewinella sp. JB7 TaxID=2962887 RepID=UPI0020C9CD8B|nr:kelch repeat-containing protein [Lewinella sp. JB7]MCP9235499.1 T9SS type A sorting domain-containing protein [Lewinella sp. JB7]